MSFVYRRPPRFAPRHRVVLTGVAAAGTTVSPDVGALDLTGFAPSALTQVASQTGALVLTGFAPSALTEVATQTGALTLTGIAPSALTEVATQTGALVLNGFAPTTAPETLTQTGALDLTGFAPFALTQVAAQPGALVLTGFAPSVFSSIITQLGELTLTGFAPSVTAGGVITPEPGALVLTSFAPTVGTAIVGQVVAWAFTLDGHTFYVLNDVNGVTFVYDTRTRQWHHWYTGTTPALWNMYRGVVWQGRTLAADEELSKIWELDPHSELDEELTQIKRVVTAFQAMRGKASMRQGSLRLTASIGEPSLTNAVVQMRYSDNEGQSWSVVHSRTLITADFDQPIRFRSLGRLRAPGRIWEISDTGGLMLIQGSDADMEGEEDGDV